MTSAPADAPLTDPHAPPPAPAAEPAPDPDPPKEEQERALFFGVSAARLRSRVRWGAVVFLLSTFVPQELIDGSPQFVWDIAPEVSLAALVAVIALPLAGLAMLVGLKATRRASSLAVVAIAALACAAVVRQLGADRSAWDTMSMPDSMSTRPAAALLAMALTAAAGNLAFREATRKTFRYVLGAAALAALYFYVWPGRGEAPLLTIGRALAHLPDLPGFRYQIGVLMLVAVTAWPILVTAAGATLLTWPPKRDEPWISIVANWGLPLLLFLLAYRALIMSQATAGLVSFLAMVLVVTAAIVVTSAAVTVLVEAFFVSHGDEAPASRQAVFAAQASAVADPFDAEKKPSPVVVGAPGMEPRRALVVGAAAVAVISAAQVVLAMPPSKGTTWELDVPPLRAERVFGELLPAWSQKRREWDFRTREDVGASARVELKASARDLVEEAKDVDPALGAAFQELTRESDDLDLAGRRWGRLVQAVNDASQRSKLPYYVDASVTVTRLKDGTLRRHFSVFSYKIHEVRRFDVGGDEFATLRVRQLGHSRDAHARMGFSSDADPFALVVLDETDRRAQEIVLLAASGGCATDPVRRDLRRRLEKCAGKLADLARDREDDVKRGVLAGTERHELQHQIDGPHLPVATTVLSYLEGYSPSYQDAVNREVSAFLAEMTADGLAPRLTLWQLLQYLLPEREGTYAHAAILVLESFEVGKVTHKRELDGAAFWDVYFELWSMGDDDLRKAAAEAYDRIYGEELPEVKPLGRGD